MAGASAFILPACLPKVRLRILKDKLVELDIRVTEAIGDALPTYVVVDDSIEDWERVTSLLKQKVDVEIDSSTIVVKANWISKCASQKKLVCTAAFEVRPPTSLQPCQLSVDDKTPKSQQVVSTKKGRGDSDDVVVQGDVADVKMKPTARLVGDADSVYGPGQKQKYGSVFQGDDSDDDDSVDEEDIVNLFASGPPEVPSSSWICTKSSTEQSTNLNSLITDRLKEMAAHYKNVNDRFRHLTYTKAIQALRNHPRQVTSFQEAKSLKGVGTRLAKKITEIVETGTFHKLENTKLDEDSLVLDSFVKIWGVGPQTAQQWLRQGIKTFDDLKSKVTLTRQQIIGFRYYDDFLQKIPRDEASSILDIVKETGSKIQDGLLIEACGSYRRGRAACGDLDILISHPDGRSHSEVFRKLIKELKAIGLLTDDLSMFKEGDHWKYLGVCKLPGDQNLYRRIDIFLTAFNEYPCALLHYTGSAYFNRSIRLLCKKRNMRLSEHALRVGTVRSGGEVLHEGQALVVKSERDVFTHLGLPYREPWERDW